MMTFSKDSATKGTKESYTNRLIRLQTAGWKRFLPVQLPYALHLKTLALPGSTLEVGCGIGRNLRVLGPSAVGIDVDRESVNYVVEALRLRAFTPAEFFKSAYGRSRFDTLLLSHVLEHVDPSRLVELVSMYLPLVRPGGRVIMITPQERGHESDSTHVCFFDFDSAVRLARTLGLTIEKQYSYPFPRPFGRIFRYNEFVTLLRVH
jgi:2-polyprenyl-3-methyl-5-hydroxy-6-metoxy-1,4-benzoquinol methylase